MFSYRHAIFMVECLLLLIMSFKGFMVGICKAFKSLENIRGFMKVFWAMNDWSRGMWLYDWGSSSKRINVPLLMRGISVSRNVLPNFVRC